MVRALDKLNNPDGSTKEPTVDATNASMERHGTDDYEAKVGDDEPELEVGEQGGEERSAPLNSDVRLLNKTSDEMLDYICGTDTTGGQLSVSFLVRPRGYIANFQFGRH